MTDRVRDDSGFALVTVIMLLFAMSAVGIALLARSDSQQSLSAHERTKQSCFNLAAAALNAEALQLSRAWPKDSSAPTSCDPTSTSTMCPQPSAVAGGYTSKDFASSCATSPTTPVWQTTVRDNAAGEQYWT
ncbi:MAG: hypothetical protein QOD53_785, partial [Thermoleophilaceae bacterium]|nr:hypothetical protein [Thermoleophilaceae bacterium]